MKMIKLQKKRLPDSRLKKWPGNKPLKKKRLEKRLPRRKRVLVLLRIRKSKKRWQEDDRKRKRTGGDKKQRLLSNASSKNKRLVLNKKSRRPKSQLTLSERMKTLGREAGEKKTKMRMSSTSNSR